MLVLVFIAVAVAVAILWINSVSAQGYGRDEDRRPEGQQRFPALRNPAICSAGDFVYVVSGDTLYQFSTFDLKLVNKARIETEPRFPPDRRDRMEDPFPPSRKTEEDKD